MEKVKQIRLSKTLENWWKIVWRTEATAAKKLQQVNQRWLIFFIQVRKCVCWSQGPLKGSLQHQGSGCNLYFPSIWYSNMSLSHKVSSTLLYNSLIIYIDWLLNRLCFLHFDWFVLFWSWLYKSTRAKQEQQRPKEVIIRYVL